MYDEREINLIVLSSFEELNLRIVTALLDGFARGEPDFEKYENFLIKTLTEGVYNKVRGKFYSAEYHEKILSGLEKRGIKCVTYFSDDYPEALKNTPCPPATLFCKGNPELLRRRAFAIVGSRKTLPAAAKLAKDISKELCGYLTIVTGAAEGADTAAIEGALDSGNVICVLANGFDHYYPAVNAQLIKSVEKRGLVVTEYTPQIKPVKYNFPLRNRIIAGLSEGALIVSAGKRSGAKITANYAVEYNRRLFAFPYFPSVSSGEGCNALIKEGALLTESVQDILTDFNIDYKPKGRAALSEEEEKILALIKESGDAFAPVIAEKMGKQPFEIIPALSGLEIKGLIVRLGGNRYSAV